MSGRFATVSHFFFYLGVSGRVAHDPSRSPEFHYTLVRRARTLSYAPRRAAPRPPTNQRLVNGAHWGASRTHSATRAQGFHIPPRLGSHGLRQVPSQTQRGVATIGLTPRTFSIARGFTERLRKRSIISRRESRRGSSLEKILRKRSIISRCEGFVAERYFGSESFRVARHDGFVAEKDTSEAKCYFASRRGSSLKDTSEAKYHFASRRVVAGFGSEVSFRVARSRRWLRKRSAISRCESRRGSSLKKILRKRSIISRREGLVGSSLKKILRMRSIVSRGEGGSSLKKILRKRSVISRREGRRWPRKRIISRCEGRRSPRKRTPSRRESRRGSSLKKILRKRSIISRREGFVVGFRSESFRVAKG